MDRALGWSPDLQGELDGGFRPRCLFLRPFVPDNRFLCELAPFTSADPEPISKYPRIETSLFRLVYGLGGEFISSGNSLAATGSPRRRLMDAAWQQEIRREIELADLIFLIPFYTPGTAWEVKAVVAGGHLDKTLFLMPPSVMGRGLDQRARNWVEMPFLFSLALTIGRTLGRAADSDAVHFEYTGRRLRAILKDPFLRDDWEAARANFEAEGLRLPEHHTLGAVFSSERSGLPKLKARLATIYGEPDSIDETAVDEIADRIRSFTATTGGNARSLLAAVTMSGGGYSHSPGVISAVLDILERQG